jgi:hypothetical protein
VKASEERREIMEKHEEHAQRSFVQLFNCGRHFRVSKAGFEKKELVDEQLMRNIPPFLPLLQKEIGKEKSIRNQLEPRESKA